MRFVATDIENLEHLDTAPGETLRLSGINEDDLVAMWAALTQTPPNPDRGIFGALVHSSGEEGPFVLVVDEAFVDALATVEPSDCERIAHDWKEAQVVGTLTLEAMRSCLETLHTFCAQARSRGLTVFHITHGAPGS